MKSKSPTTEQPTDGYTNSIDWNNALTGSPRNVIELKIDQIGGNLGTNAVHEKAKAETFQKVFDEAKQKLDEIAQQRAASVTNHTDTVKP